MKAYIERITVYLIYATFFVPLVVVPSSFIFPFIVPKILLFRTLAICMFAGYLLLLRKDWRAYEPKFTLLHVAALFFLLSFTLSTVLGADAYHSFWDNHERMLGLFTIIHYVLYYLVASAVLKDWIDWRRALRVFLFAGSVVMILGLVQVNDPQFLLNQGSNRVASTLGNAIYVGGYGLFLFFVSVLLFFTESAKAWKCVDVVCGILAILGLFFSGTRGSMVGLLAGILSAMLGYAVVFKDRPRVRTSAVAVIVCLALAFAGLYAKRDTSWVQTLPVFGRLFTFSFHTGTGSTRLIAWNIAVESWKDRPFFGWGPNNFFYAFNQHYNPRSLEYGYGETWFDNAHNILFNTLTVQGLVGLGAYLFIFVAAILMLWRQQKRREHLHVVVIGTAFLIAHLVQNISVFENPTSYLYFMFWLAMVNRLSSSPAASSSPVKQVVKPRVVPKKGVGYGLVMGVLAAAGVWIWLFDIQPARANQKTLRAMMMFNQNPVTGLSIVQEAMDFESPHMDDIHSDLSRAIISVLGAISGQLGKDKTNEMADVAYKALQQNVRLHPLDIRTYIELAQLSHIRAINNNDARYLYEAEQALITALGYSPRRQQLIYTLSAIKMQIGKGGEAVQLLQGALNDDPKVGESYWRLGYTYQLLGNLDKAKETIALARERHVGLGEGENVAKSIEAASLATRTKK